MGDPINPDKRNLSVNPSNTNTITKTDWSVKPPKTGEYDIWVSQNTIDPLVCDAYLPELRTAIDKAERSIYITVWGFDAALPLVLDRSESTRQKYYLGELLKEKMMNSQPQALPDSQESELYEAAESESQNQIGPADSTSAKPQSEEVNS